MESFLKDKKKIGICVVFFIVIMLCFVKYVTSGSTELKKNGTENIFVEEENKEEDSVSSKSSSNSTKSKAKEGSESQEVFTSDSKKKTITVEIKGAVNNPDVYTLEDNSIIKDLIDKAGGLTENADLSDINRAKKLQDHELIYIADKNETAVDNAGSTGGNTSASAAAASSGSATGVKAALSGAKVNINTAGEDELKKINGIGDSKAKSIISYRESNGGFSSIEDLKNVDGIGEKMFEKMKDQVEV